ncbi:MAG: SWIB/MDM2 domain-containing protein [Chlamydiota bacterium]
MVVKKKAKSRVKTTVKKAKTARKTTVKRAKTVKKAKTVKRAKTVKKAKTVKRAKTARKTTGKRTSGLTTLTYSVSEDLQAIVGGKTLTRPEIVKKLWAYIKANKCQDTKNRRLIVPDAKLSKVIGSKPVDMMKLAGLLSKHIK